VGDGVGLPGMARVMSHDVKRIPLVYDINLASARGPSARTIVPHSPSRPHTKTDGRLGTLNPPLVIPQMT